MAQAYFLENEDGEKFYPVSHADATFNRNGQLIGDVLDKLSEEVNQFNKDTTDLSDAIPCNMIPFPYYESSHESEGISWTIDEEGIVTADGTATGYSIFTVAYIENILESLVIGSSYYLTGCPDGGSDTTYCMQMITLRTLEGASSVVDQFFTQDASGTLVKLTQEYEQLSIQIVIMPGCSVSNLKFKPMLTQGDSAKPYHRSFNSAYELTKKMDYTNIAYCTCETDGGTAEKIINIVGNPYWKLTEGSIIVVKFTNTSTASNVTLNVNDTGAKSIYYDRAVYTGNSGLVNGYAGRFIMYMYDGTNWIWLTHSIDANTTYTNEALGSGYGICETDSATSAKVVTFSNYNLTMGGIVAVKFTNAITGNATMNINSKGAKSIYYRGAPITADVIKAGDIATFIYNGNQYHLLTVDRDSIPSYYGICSTDAATADKSVDCEGFTLVTGAAIKVRFTVSNTATDITLNVNGTGAKNIRYRNANITTSNAGYFAANRTYEFVYDGSYYQLVGDLDSNTFDRIRYSFPVKCGATAIVANNLIVGKDGAYTHLKLGQAFDITYPILVAAQAIAVDGTNNQTYKALPMTITTTQAITLTPYEPVYIKGKLSGTIFTPVSTAPLTQEVPTSDDGYQYIKLGLAYSTTQLMLDAHNPIYEYRDNSFKIYTPTHQMNLISSEDDLMLNSVEGYSVDALLVKAINSKINGIEFQIVDGKLQYRYDQEVWG